MCRGNIVLKEAHSSTDTPTKAPLPLSYSFFSLRGVCSPLLACREGAKVDTTKENVTFFLFYYSMFMDISFVDLATVPHTIGKYYHNIWAPYQPKI
jgi:hypothetical protein